MMNTHVTEFILKGNGSDISIDFHEPILIPSNAKLGLKNFVTYNNIPNITENYNNQIRLRAPGKKEYETFSLETGAYELTSICTQIQEWFEEKHPNVTDVRDNFKLIGNEATSKAEFIFKDDFGVDFNVDKSLHQVLCFENTVKHEGKGRYIGKYIVNITNVTQLIFNCNVIEVNYINDIQVPFIYNCPVNVPPGFRLSRELINISYKKLNTTQISNIRVWIVDENGGQVDLREDSLIVTLSLKIDEKND